MKLNQKGQAFSVFKLLIAAIVALAILAILLPILKIPAFGANPNDEAVSQVKTLYNSPGEYRLSKAVTFSTQSCSPSLNAKSIAQQSQLLSTEQIWLDRGDFASGEQFVLSNDGSIVSYNASGSRQVKLGVMCDSSSEIEDSLNSQGIDPEDPRQSNVCDTGTSHTCFFITLKAA